MMSLGLIKHYLPSIIIFAAAIWVIWHFFVKRWISLLLYSLGYLRYSAIDDEKRGMNEHVRLLRKIFKTKQKFHRKCYYRLLTNKDGSIMTSVLNGRTMYCMLCLETGEKRDMCEEWLYEALHFKIVSNAAMSNGKVKIVPDVFTGTVPEYNIKVGDISYFNRIIGTYSDWSIVQMDTEAIMKTLY